MTLCSRIADCIMNNAPDIRPAAGPVRWFLRTFGYGGITIPPIAIYILAERINEAPLIRHEQCHWQQAQRMGVLRWYVNYLWYNLRYSYWNNPLEVEARDAEIACRPNCI